MEKLLGKIRTMKEDIIRLQKEGGAVSYDKKKEEKRQKERLRIEEQVKTREEEAMKKEEESLLRSRKEERLKEITLEKKKEQEEKQKAEEAAPKVVKPAPVFKPKEVVKKAPVPKVEPKPESELISKLSRKEILFNEKEGLRKERFEIRQDMDKILEQKQPLEKKKALALSKLEDVKKSFHSIIVKERKVEEIQKALEEKEMMAKTSKQMKKIEKERWRIEETRRRLEKARWPWDEKIKELDISSQEAEEELLVLSSKEVELSSRQEAIVKKEENIASELKKIRLREDLEEAKKLRESFEGKITDIETRISKVGADLNEVLGKEKQIEQKKKIIEEEELETKDIDKKRGLEKERWGVEEKRREIESKRWELDDLKDELASQLEKVKSRIDSISEKEKDILTEISEIDKSLEDKPVVSKAELESKPKPKPEPGPEQKPESVEKPEEEQKGEAISVPSGRKEKLEQAKKRIESLRKAMGEREKKSEELEEKIQEKKRLEQKRITAEKEKSRKHEESLAEREKRRKELLGRLQSPLSVEQKMPPPPTPSEFVKKLPKKLSKRNKLLVRIILVVLVIIILTAIVTFWYWYLRVRPQYPVGEGNGEITQEEGGPGEITGNGGKPGVSEAIFNVDDVRNLSVANLGEVSDLLFQTLQEIQVDDQFRRIVIKRDDKEINLQEFMQSLSIRMPDGFYNKVDDKMTLFVYSQPQGNRLGLISRIDDTTNLNNMLSAQESTMEEDLKPMFELVGQTKPAVINYFRSARNVLGYEGPDFRYKTIGVNDIGICYTLSDQFYVLTSSWKAMERILNKLEVSPPKQELTMDLKIGNKNDEVTILQTWLAKDARIYPEGIISGYYGSLTKKAVTRFQEKYASDILAPQGFEEGTGIVDSFTRNKLNELYAIH